MPRTHYIMTNFTAGEISPLTQGRVDISKYHNGCSELTNYVIMPAGSVTRRGGFHFVDECKYPNKRARLIPFEFSSVKAYVVEVGDHYMRFFMDGYLIRIMGGSELLTNNTFDSDIVPWVDKSTDDGYVTWNATNHTMEVGISDTPGVGIAEQKATVINHRYYHVKFDISVEALKVRVGTVSGEDDLYPLTSFDIGTGHEIEFWAEGTDAFIQFVYDSDVVAHGEVDNVYCKEFIPYEILDTPYSETDLPDLQWRQSNDTLYITHPKYKQRELTRTAHTSWTLTPMTFIDGPYRAEVETPTITPSDTSGDIGLDASAPLFYSGHEGALWRLRHTSTWGYVIITEVVSETHAHATVLSTLGGTTPTDSHCEGSWSDYRGWPRSLIMHEGRLVFGGNEAEPQTNWGSEVDDYYDFTPGVLASNPYTYKIAGGHVDYIQWLETFAKMIAGTTGGEYKLSGPGEDPISPAAPPDIKLETTYGCKPVMPIRVGRSILFLQKAGRKIREFTYNWESDSYLAPDMTVLADHLVFYGIKEMIYQQEPHSVVWVRTSQDLLLGMTYDRLNDVVGWHQHPTQGTIESLCSIPVSNILEDQLWVIAKRIVGGVPKHYVEYLDTYAYTDSCLTYSGPPITKATGLDHLVGEVVQIVGDGAVYPPETVNSNGEIILEGPAASEIEAGKGFTSRLVSLRPEIPIEGNTSQGIKKHWSKIIVRVYETIGISINGKMVDFRTSDDEMDEGIALFSGDISVSNVGRDSDAKVIIEQTQPLPSTIVCLIGVIDIGD